MGPVLFLIFVHDLPKPLSITTLISQFADDVIHVVKSDSQGKNRANSVIKKLQRELQATLEWEENWKIKTSLEKIKVGFCGISMETLVKAGGNSN